MPPFELEFLDDLNTPLPSNVIARVRVVAMSGAGDDPPRNITANCATQSEFDWWVDRLISELEKIRKEGHKKFAAYDSARAMHS